MTIEERRREGRRNLPNIVRIVSKEWTSWLARGGGWSRPPAEPLIGCKKMRPSDNRDKRELSRRSEAVFAAEGQQADLAAQYRQRPRHDWEADESTRSVSFPDTKTGEQVRPIGRAALPG